MDSTKGETDILYLNEDDMIEAGVLDAGRCVDVMEETMGIFSDGDCLMGGPSHDAHGLMLFFPKESPIPGFPLNDSADRRFIAMPGLAVRHLARPDSKVLMILGPGVIGKAKSKVSRKRMSPGELNATNRH